MNTTDGLGSVYGTSFGKVTVTDVKAVNASNPSEFLPLHCPVAKSLTQACPLLAALYRPALDQAASGIWEL